MRIGVDTNVLFYSLNEASPFHREARETIARLVEERSAVITQQNLVELAAVLTKRGVPSGASSRIVQTFQESMPELRPTSETMETFLKEMESSPLKGARVFDLYLASTLISNGVELIYTYKEKDFSGISGLRVWKPEAQF